MRISAVALLSPPREPRVLRLKPGLNIITGWSGTGKSSLLDIVEYCLGRTHPTYPAGVLSQAVWGAVLTRAWSHMLASCTYAAIS